jgi:poly-gamma-glutamate capsule biosynthesis protein CapA/YwtB (metallophosphatase superfamily)
MHPANIPRLTVARLDYCSLANNHVLDWGYAGLAETVATLRNVNIKHTGAGQNLHEAATPAVMKVKGKGRVIVFAHGMETSGIPPSWAALEDALHWE